MVKVGIRALRNGLSRYLDDVRGGGEIVVTDHGRPIARIVGMDSLSTVDELIEEGLISAAETDDRWRPEPRIVPTEPVSPMIGDERR